MYVVASPNAFKQDQRDGAHASAPLGFLTSPHRVNAVWNVSLLASNGTAST